ncbi:MAG: insulinase family protein [Deltaproteobacteria bacterium]|nr:insulinase family protein [Deltaproteobacteria bacterium]
MTFDFKLLYERDIQELRITAQGYRHEKTGAQILSISADDENKVFGITFRTPPSNSTGVAHILEHSVLCGSRKYPLKEPFVELLKGSLQTFLNAFTYPDKTCYPVASQNLQDFHNLIDVYLDAVFYPRITPPIFQQEGWHFELNNLDDPITYKGVVFNEMKGAYSSPDHLLSEISLQSLFPDTPYGHDSGGDPKKIPDLAFEQFREFHRRYYHPSNARIFFYGDDDPDERLKIIDGYLKDFDPIAIDSRIDLQPGFAEPRRITRPFMVGKDQTGESKGMVTVNWGLAETTDVETNLALSILTYILLGMPGSPLRKRLIDSGLGEDIAGAGMENELRQIYFSTGLKGVETGNMDKVEPLVMDALKDLTASGIDPLTIEAALNSIEFRLRENHSGGFPRGLLLMLRALTTWLYDGDPLALLTFEAPLEGLKSKIKTHPSFFEEMIERCFLTNTHRSTVMLKPDPKLQEQEQAREQTTLAETRSEMDTAMLADVMENTKVLKTMQQAPDPPEALATIPILKREELDRVNKTIPTTASSEDDKKTLYHDLSTNGIVYFDVGFDLHCLTAEHLPYVPLFGRALTEMGTTKEDFVTLGQRISRKTGGIRSQWLTSSLLDREGSTAWLFLRGKAMADRTEAMIRIYRDVLLKTALDNKARFRQMVLEEKAKLEQKLVPAGHQMINLRLRAQFAESHWAAEQMSGISYLFFLRRLTETVDTDWPAVLSVLEQIRDTLLIRERMLSNITVDQTEWERIEPALTDFISAVPQAPTVVTSEWLGKAREVVEGLTIPAQVNYVGKGINLYDLGYQYHGSAQVITRYLRNTWLWDQIRVQGGAYGAFCLLDRLSGALAFVSYRDPNLLKTVDIFDRSARFLRETHLDETELTKSIIGAIGDLDAHMLPDAKGFTAMVRHLTHDTEAARQQMRDEILRTTPEDFKAMADVLEQVKENGIVKILGSPAAMEAVENERPGWLMTVKVM